MLSTHNICFGRETTKIFFFVRLTKGLIEYSQVLLLHAILVKVFSIFILVANRVTTESYGEHEDVVSLFPRSLYPFEQINWNGTVSWLFLFCRNFSDYTCKSSARKDVDFL